jgi:hypothetical protein
MTAGLVTVECPAPQTLAVFWTGPNRACVGSRAGDGDSGVEWRVAAGATVLGESALPALRSTVLSDAGGNTFCVGG